MPCHFIGQSENSCHFDSTVGNYSSDYVHPKYKIVVLANY